jgi:hypothetical protein
MRKEKTLDNYIVVYRLEDNRSLLAFSYESEQY